MIWPQPIKQTCPIKAQKVNAKIYLYLLHAVYISQIYKELERVDTLIAMNLDCIYVLGNTV